MVVEYRTEHPGYWLANDGKLYPNSMYPGYWLANDGNWYPGYTHPSYAPNTAGAAKVNRMAVLALVAGIVTSLVLLIPEHVRMAMSHLWLALSIVASMASLAGTVAGILALSQIRRTHERGKAQAIIGLIPCLFVIAVEVVVIIIYMFGIVLLEWLPYLVQNRQA